MYQQDVLACFVGCWAHLHALQSVAAAAAAAAVSAHDLLICLPLPLPETAAAAATVAFADVAAAVIAGASEVDAKQAGLAEQVQHPSKASFDVHQDQPVGET